MTPPSLPPHIAARLGQPHTRDACEATVAAAEAHGRRIRVERLQLGSPNAPGYNEWRVVYETPERMQDGERLSAR